MHYEHPITDKPDDGCYIYGLFLEGSKFDYNTMALGECEPKV